MFLLVITLVGVVPVILYCRELRKVECIPTGKDVHSSRVVCIPTGKEVYSSRVVCIPTGEEAHSSRAGYVPTGKETHFSRTVCMSARKEACLVDVEVWCKNVLTSALFGVVNGRGTKYRTEEPGAP